MSDECDTATAAQRYLSITDVADAEMALVLLIDNRESKNNKTLSKKFTEKCSSLHFFFFSMC